MSGETEQNESGWTVDTLKYHTDQRFVAVHETMSNLKDMLDERYQTQTKATDAAFAAQQKAMETAFIAADKAVQTALLSAEKAVTKAENAAEKRFEAVNEFRGQLADQASLFLTRTEYAANHTNLVERVNEMNDRITRAEGQDAGVKMSTGVLVSVITIGVLVIGLIVTVANLLIGN